MNQAKIVWNVGDFFLGFFKCLREVEYKIRLRYLNF